MTYNPLNIYVYMYAGKWLWVPVSVRKETPTFGEPDKARRRRTVLADLPTTPHSGSASRNSLVGWRLLAPSGATAAPAPRTVALPPGTHATAREVALPAPEIATSTRVRPPASAMKHPPAGTIGASVAGRKIVPTLAATASKAN
jgi:hypothetical protein